jgi:diaminopimelate decarboxylase
MIPPTPYYSYDLELLDHTLNEMRHWADMYGFLPHYAMKANHNRPILERVKAMDFGLDCVSGGEIERGLELGFSGERMILSGVGKRPDEILLALRSNVRIQVESEAEFRLIRSLLTDNSFTARIGLRINPNLEAGTHDKISTGRSSDKFGISTKIMWNLISQTMEDERLSFQGIHMHIGSQITDLERFRQMCHSMNEIIETYLNIYGVYPEVNVGGGLGIDYHAPSTHPVADFRAYFETIRSELRIPDDMPVLCEPGRSVVGQCGELMTSVLYIKENADKIFVIVDAGMSELMRPALYGAYHRIECVGPVRPCNKPVEVVGPICESSDSFGFMSDPVLPEVGSLLRIRSAGAYGQCMSNAYNLRQQSPAHYHFGQELGRNPYFYQNSQDHDGRGSEKCAEHAFSGVY